jgi:hypothetical protein
MAGAMAPGMTAMLFRRTGSQFFLRDADVPVPVPSTGASVNSHQLPADSESVTGPCTPPDLVNCTFDAPMNAIALHKRVETGAILNQCGQPSARSVHGCPKQILCNAGSSAAALSPPARCAPTSTLDAPATTQNVSLLLQLAFDVEGGLPFLSALAAFRSRSCYANSDGDHLVGWANSSLRFKAELPKLDAHTIGSNSIGVAHSDPVVAAFAPSACAGVDSAQGADEQEGRPIDIRASEGQSACSLSSGGVPRALVGSSMLSQGTRPEQGRNGSGENGTTGQDLGSRPEKAHLLGVIHYSRSEKISAMLRSLQSLPWARIDCTWRAARVSVFAHNHIQVTRRWLNLEVCIICPVSCAEVSSEQRKLPTCSNNADRLCGVV